MTFFLVGLAGFLIGMHMGMLLFAHMLHKNLTENEWEVLQNQLGLNKE